MTSQTNCGIIKNVIHTTESIILAEKIERKAIPPSPTVKDNVRISNKTNEKLVVSTISDNLQFDKHSKFRRM